MCCAVKNPLSHGSRGHAAGVMILRMDADSRVLSLRLRSWLPRKTTSLAKGVCMHNVIGMREDEIGDMVYFVT